MMKEVCCMGVTANPRFDVQKCCVVAYKRNHFDFLSSCKPLQNIVKVEALHVYATMVLYMLGAKKNRLIETVLLSTHNICFG